MPNPKEATVSIIIVNYRSEHYLDKCLVSIYGASDARQFEIIVVNNDRKTDLHKIAEKYPTIKIFNCKKNVGFGAACNYGANKSRGNILFFLNPDTQFLNNYIGDVLKKIKEADKRVGIIGPKLMTDDGETQAWCAGKDQTIGQRIKNKTWMGESKEIWESKEEIFVDWVSGAALVIKKEIFEKIEGFDENFFMYAEDLDLCAKTRDLGYRVLYCPQMVILHSGGKSRENVFKQKIQFFRSSFYYIKKRISNKSRN